MRAGVKKYWWIYLLTVLLVGGVYGLFVLVRQKPESHVYQGRTVLQWCRTLNSAQPLERNAAVEAFQRMDGEAVPGLLSLLDLRDSALTESVWRNLTSIPRKLRRSVTRVVPPSDLWQVRAAAIQALGLIGPEASNAVPRLAQFLSDNRRQFAFAAAGSLARIGAPAVDALATALSAPEPQARRSAAFGLSQMGAEAQAAWPALLRGMEDQDDEVRSWSIQAVAAIGRIAMPAPRRGRPANPPVAPVSAPLQLEQLRTALPQLVTLLRADSADLRLRAVEAVEPFLHLEPDSQTPGELDRLAREDPDPRVKAAAQRVLTKARRD